MAAGKDRIGARQPDLAESGGTLSPVPNVDVAWVAQAIEARKLAFRLYRLDLQEDLTSVLRTNICRSAAGEVARKLMDDYLTANEKLFDLAAAQKAREPAPKSQSEVDNSTDAATVGHLPSGCIEE